MTDNVATPSVINALDTAAAFRGYRSTGVIFHSDRGSQYLSGDFAQALRCHQMRQSVGRVSNCWDNPSTESFFAPRKCGEPAIFAWIGRYNTPDQAPSERPSTRSERVLQ